MARGLDNIPDCKYTDYEPVWEITIRTHSSQPDIHPSWWTLDILNSRTLWMCQLLNSKVEIIKAWRDLYTISAENFPVLFFQFYSQEDLTFVILTFVMLNKNLNVGNQSTSKILRIICFVNRARVESCFWLQNNIL